MGGSNVSHISFYTLYPFFDQYMIIVLHNKRVKRNTNQIADIWTRFNSVYWLFRVTVH